MLHFSIGKYKNYYLLAMTTSSPKISYLTIFVPRIPPKNFPVWIPIRICRSELFTRSLTTLIVSIIENPMSITLCASSWMHLLFMLVIPRTT